MAENAVSNSSGPRTSIRSRWRPRDCAASRVLLSPGPEEAIGWVRENRHPGDFRQGLLEQGEPLPVQRSSEGAQLRDVPARSSEARDESVLDGTVIGRHDNGDAAGGLLRGK